MGYCYEVWLVTVFVVCCDCNGVSAGIWVLHSSGRSGCELVTPFGSDCYDGGSAGLWVYHSSDRSKCELVTLIWQLLAK